MNIFKRYNIKSILLTISWLGIGSVSLVLLVAAVHSRDKKLCKGLEVSIHGVSNNFFIDKDDVKNIISSYAGDINAAEIETFNLVAMEAELKREVWIKNAELFFDNNLVLQALVEEREPVARIFTTGGNTFYIDNTNMMLPLSSKISARLPVFTNFPSDTRVLSKKDSSLLMDIKNLSVQIQQDSFLMAMIDQVDITPQRNFEMIPKIGDQVILFGDASDAAQKFKKLQLFYKKVMMKYGWSRYSIINLQYNGQVVAKLKGKDDVSADSLRTQEIMHAIAINTARAASDSVQTIIQDNERNTTDLSLIQQSLERDEGEEPAMAFPKYPVEPNTPVVVVTAAVKPVIKSATTAPKTPVFSKTTLRVKPIGKQVNRVVNNPSAPKPIHPKASTAKQVQTKFTSQPKVVMPKKNDY